MNLYQRIVKIMASMGAVGKGGRVDYGEKYAFHKIDDIDEKLRLALIEHGVVCIITEINDRKLEYFVEKDKYGKERSAWYAECAITIELINADNPEERKTIRGWGQGLDYSDKATGKAVSYASKAAYLSAFHLRGQPDNEQDNIVVSQEKEVPLDEMILTEAQLSWVSAVNQAEADCAEALANLGDKIGKEPKDVQDVVWKFYTRSWANIISKQTDFDELFAIGKLLAAESADVQKAVKPLFKTRAGELKKKKS